ncbi:alpha/beta fold hydrolase [Vibrio marisflavi]|uniref:Esterase YbfF n=1 Tax=Vibrio marisflavi CECT 7928 TaxID=634439 RepID=A0ABM9A378_9VIBR|nr:alpha/beta fold hydrolase [Vibrio marisflavi]CAH0539113.1 Esterase YbfF [Vibrio marisflavi CECT 7928]
MSQLLNYKLEGEGHTIVLIHGLFGNLDNLGVLARELKKEYQVLSVDLRNHGRSFHSDEINYSSMAEDVRLVLEHLQINAFTLIGHSMGGKVAIKLADIERERTQNLIVLDMSPVAYTSRKHDNVLAGLHAVMEGKPTSRSSALQAMARHIEMDGVRQFLSKSLYNNDGVFSWRFNVLAVEENYWNILGWQDIETLSTPTLFVKGGESDYLLAEHQTHIQKQFSNVKAHVIANAGHWLHAEKPNEVLRAVTKFIQSK